MLKCILVEDHPLFRDGVKTVFEQYGPTEGVALVGACATGEGGIEMFVARQPDVAILDHRLGRGQMDGLTCAERIRDLDSEARLLLFSSLIDSVMLERGTLLGITGFIQKEAHGQELIRAVRVVGMGGHYVDATMRRDSQITLTPRETEIVQALAEGEGYDQMASRLHLSAETTRTHGNHAIRKLGARNKTHAACLAQHLGLIETPEG